MNAKQILPSDYPKLKKFFESQKYGLCAYSLASIIVWRNNVYQPYGTIDGDAFIVWAEFTTRKEDRHLILPVSPVREFTPEELHDLAVKLGFEKFCFVPDEYLENYGRSAVEAFFEVEEQEEYADYVYLTDDLASLKGNRYAKKRNLIKQFQRDYTERDRVKVEKITSLVASECLDFLEKWCEERDCDANPEEDLACEKLAAINTLENIEVLEVNGLFLRVDNEISAFGIASHLKSDMGVLHFEKAFSGIKGLYQYFDNLCAKRLFNGYKYIN
ncbi:MAG: DUF2156 domain-containing protein, partial [Deltaproteobacteria bacterium]|nr:DUF2156 domain-containing protein [Deltaproteobacteria bacterium]